MSVCAALPVWTGTERVARGFCRRTAQELDLARSALAEADAHALVALLCQVLPVVVEGMGMVIDSASGESVMDDSDEGAVRRAVGRFRGCQGQ